MVDDGETATALPLLTEMLPGVMTPVPPEKTAVRLELDPAVIVEGLAVKLLMDGGEITFTVRDFETDLPLEPVTLSVYVVVDAGATEKGVPLVTGMLPGVTTPVPLEKTAVRVELEPAVMVVGFAVKLLMLGLTGFAEDFAAQEVEPMTKIPRIRIQMGLRSFICLQLRLRFPEDCFTRLESWLVTRGQENTSRPEVREGFKLACRRPEQGMQN